MSTVTVQVWVLVCDGCGQEAGQGYGSREVHDTKEQALQSADTWGWTCTSFTNGTHLCPDCVRQLAEEGEDL